MRKIRAIAALTAIWATTMPRTASADDTPETPAYWMDEIVVTATRTQHAIRDLSASVSVVTRQEIEASNANSCMDVLGALPGLFVQRTGAFGRADVDIRGIGERARKVMVLVDGRPVKMGIFGCTVTHSLPLSNVERIEVVRGPSSVLYGSDALGGVINIITRKLAETQEVDGTISYGTFGTVQYGVRGGMARGPVDFYVTADSRRSDGHLANSAYDGQDLTARAGYWLTQRWGLSLSSTYFEAHKQEPLRATDPDTMVSGIWEDYHRGAVDLTLTGRWNAWDTTLKVYRNFGEHEFWDGWHSTDFTNGATLNASGRLSARNELTAGLEFRQQGGEALGTFPGSWRKSEVAVFCHDEQTLAERLVLTFGARCNHDEVSGNVLCPQAGVVLHARPGTTLRATANRAFRAPQINELYVLPPANADLEPETVTSYEAGVTQQLVRGVDVDLTGYVSDGDNLIQKESLRGGGPPFRFQNTGTFRFTGLEVALRAQLAPAASARISYTYLNPGAKTQGRPGDKLDLALRGARGRLGVSLGAQYVARYFAADNSLSPIPDYFVADTKLTYRLTSGLRATLAVDNLFDNAYDVYVDLSSGAGVYSMPGRSFSGGLVLEL